LERGNNDLIVVGLSMVSTYLLARQDMISFVVAATCIVAATVLKIYPVVLLAVLILYAFRHQRTKPRVSVAVAASAASALYFVAIAPQLPRMRDGTPTPVRLAYGWQTFRHQLAPTGALTRADMLLIVASLGAVLWLTMRGRPFASTVETVRHWAASPARTSIVCGLALFGASLPFANYSYRLVTLIPVLAGASTFLDGDRHQRALASSVVAAALVTGAVVTLSGTADDDMLPWIGTLAMVGCAAICLFGLCLALAPAPLDDARLPVPHNNPSPVSRRHRRDRYADRSPSG
jgi:hypothetical protein